MITMEVRRCVICDKAFTTVKAHVKKTCSFECKYKSVGINHSGRRYVTVKKTVAQVAYENECAVIESHRQVILSVEYGDEGNVL